MDTMTVLVLSTLAVFIGTVLVLGDILVSLGDHRKFSIVKASLSVTPWFLIVTAWANYLV